jgi:inner membrane transporter RhtA
MMDPMRPEVRAPLLVLGSSLAGQSGAAIAVGLIGSTSVLTAVFLRTAWAGVLLLALLAARGVRLRRSDLTAAIAFAVVLAYTNTAFYAAVSRLPLGDCVAIEFLGPISVAIATSRSRIDLIWIAAAFAGVFAITRRSAGPLNTAGLLFTLMAGSGWGAYTIVGRRLAVGERREQTLSVALLCSGIVLLLPALLASPGALASPRWIATGAAVGLLSSAIPYSLELLAVRSISLTTFGVLLSLQPFMAAATGLVILRQSVSLPEITGFLLISVASIGVTVAGARRARTSAADPSEMTV